MWPMLLNKKVIKGTKPVTFAKHVRKENEEK